MITDSPHVNTLIADDHPAIARLLGDFLATQPRVVVAGVVHTGPAVLEFCATHPVDFLVLDLGLPGMSGLEVLAVLQTEFPRVRTLVFSALFTEKVIQSALELGARGFVEKTAAFEEISEAFTRVIGGQTYMGPAVRAAIIHMMRSRNDQPPLTAEEVKLLRWLSEGAVNKDISTRLGVSLSGTYKMIDRVKAKIGAKTPADLIFSGIQHGVISVPEVQV